MAKKTTLSRLADIAGVLARHGFAPTMASMPLVRAFAKGDDDVALRDRPVEERFTAVLEELGPTFVKLGQILSTRADLLPPSFITSLSRLQDQVPPFSLDEVKIALAEAWGGQPETVLKEHLAHFDEVPLASASMAQVHGAVLKDGQHVVVKVQRPGIRERVRQDSELLVVLAQLLEAVIVEARTYRAASFLTEFKRALEGELDFRLEAKNLRAFADYNKARPFVHVPAFVPSLSGRTVLVMERIRGKRITDVSGEQAEKVVERLVETAFEHVFSDGLFHGDPHPGNLLVDDEGRLAFIDFGLVGLIPRDLQDRLIMLLIALNVKDADTVSRLVLRIGDAEGRVPIAPFRAEIGTLIDRYFGLRIDEVPTSAVFADLIDLSTRFGVRLPRELAILSKASISMDGVVRALHPTFDPTSIVASKAETLLRARLDPRNLSGGGTKSALQLALLIQELPSQLGQALLDLERGQVQVTVHSEALNQLNATLRGVGMTIFGGILAGALVLCGFLLLNTQNLPPARAALFAIAIFAVAGGLFGVAFAWYITGGRLPKVSLGRLLAARMRSKKADIDAR